MSDTKKLVLGTLQALIVAAIIGLTGQAMTINARIAVLETKVESVANTHETLSDIQRDLAVVRTRVEDIDRRLGRVEH